MHRMLFPLFAVVFAACTEPKTGEVPTDTDTTETDTTGPTLGTPGGGNGGGGGTTGTTDLVDTDQDGDPDVTDCDDFDNDIHAGAPEITTDGVDNDCDGEIDESDDNSGAILYYFDADGDGYGDDATTVMSTIDPGQSWVVIGGDCNDLVATINPGVLEVTGNGIDDDCDATTVDTVMGSYWHYVDSDGDGFGAVLGGIQDASSSPPVGYVNNDDDCDDAHADTYLGAVEVVDGRDNDCDGSIDEGGGALPPCTAGQSYVTIQWTAPSASVSNLNLSGMVETATNEFTPDYYTQNFATGVPLGMTVTKTVQSVTAAYGFCTPDGSRWEFSPSYTDSIGTPRYGCEGAAAPFTVNGTIIVTVDGLAHAAPTTVSNGGTGCEFEFFQ